MKMVWLPRKGVESHQDVITPFEAGLCVHRFPKALLEERVSSDPLSCSKYAEYALKAWIMINAQVIA